MSYIHDILIVAVVAGVTIALRFLPFFILGEKRQTPKIILYLGKVLPLAIMATLVVYCLRGTTFDAAANFIPQVVAVAVTAGVHFWKKNTLLSVLGGTVTYMYLVQMIF